MAEEQIAPGWVFDQNETSDFFEKEAISTEEMNRLASMNNDISEEDLVSERTRIENCSSDNTPYLYNAQWPVGVKASLKEYAIVCGMDMSKFRSIESSKIPKQASQSSSSIIVTSSKKEDIVLADAFKIDEKISNSYKKAKWQPEIKGEMKLADKPSMQGSVIPVRGGENYFENSESKVARGQNSISDPSAIEKLANESKEDTGARLHRENLEKEESKKTRHQEWQQEKIAAMDGKEILQNRRVFPTEVMNAQPGIKGNVFDFTSVPERTEGEKIRTANDERRREIQGADKQKYEFETQKAPVRNISEDFASELSKYLKQVD